LDQFSYARQSAGAGGNGLTDLVAILGVARV
jgi:hypothetical protein